MVDWIFIEFLHEKPGKLSKPWYGPYRILMCNDPDIMACKVYFPEEGQL